MKRGVRMCGTFYALWRVGLRLGSGRHRERIGPIACRVWILVFESGKVGSVFNYRYVSARKLFQKSEFKITRVNVVKRTQI